MKGAGGGPRRGAGGEDKPGRYAVYELKGGHPSTVVGMSYGQGRAEALRTLVDEAPSDEGSVAIAASALRPHHTRARQRTSNAERYQGKGNRSRSPR